MGLAYLTVLSLQSPQILVFIGDLAYVRIIITITIIIIIMYRQQEQGNRRDTEGPFSRMQRYRLVTQVIAV